MSFCSICRLTVVDLPRILATFSPFGVCAFPVFFAIHCEKNKQGKWGYWLFVQKIISNRMFGMIICYLEFCSDRTRWTSSGWVSPNFTFSALRNEDSLLIAGHLHTMISIHIPLRVNPCIWCWWLIRIWLFGKADCGVNIGSRRCLWRVVISKLKTFGSASKVPTE